MSLVVLAGGRNLAISVLAALLADGEHTVAGIICRTDDTGEDGAFPSLLKRACDLGIPNMAPASISSPESAEQLAGYGAHIIVSAMYNQIFRKPLIDDFNGRLGIVNIHYAPLPRYCGFWPEMWAIWNGEKTFGVTIHYVDEGIDTGDIIGQAHFDIVKYETRRSLYEKCDRAASDLFADKSTQFLRRRIQGQVQDRSQRTYFKRELPNSGYIDPSWDYETISRFVRATGFDPFVGAKFRFGDKIFSVVDHDIQFFKPYSISQD